MKYIKNFKFWISFLVLAYTFVGFLFIPWFIQNKLPIILKDKAGINLSIGKASFNPYSFELTLNNIVINYFNKKPAFKLKSFYANYTIFGLLDKTFLFSNIAIDSPLLYATIDRNRKINFKQTFPMKTKKKSETNSIEATKPWGYLFKNTKIIKA